MIFNFLAPSNLLLVWGEKVSLKMLSNDIIPSLITLLNFFRGSCYPFISVTEEIVSFGICKLPSTDADFYMECKIRSWKNFFTTLKVCGTERNLKAQNCTEHEAKKLGEKKLGLNMQPCCKGSQHLIEYFHPCGNGSPKLI